MTNTVWKDAQGNVVAEGTEGATQYKVLTTWAEAWSTSGSDYLGMSNSAYYGNGGNGNATVVDVNTAAKTTTVGVWATSANVNPNAYNWNTFYNLYQQSIGADSTTYSDWGTVTSTGSSPDGVSAWDSSSGVWCGFKYRPDVVTTNNNLSAANAATYISYINNGQYCANPNVETTGEGQQAKNTYTPVANEDGTYDTATYYVYGDETYNPQIVAYSNASFYNFSNSLYELAAAGEAVIEETADNPGLDSGEALTWKTVNKLPRSSRYTETPTECALSYEKLIKGSAYYTLSKINDGTVDRKKVALVNTDFSSEDVAEGTVKVVVLDFVEQIGQGPVDGMSGWLSLCVDQLSTSTPSGDKAGTGGGGGGGGASSTSTPYQYYIATADDLASCDAIYMPESTKTATQWQEWIEKYATTDALKANASSINYVVNGMPCATNGSNFTIEKTLYPVMAMDCIYPELFPNMQLSTYWCDAIYHLNSSSLASAMSWIYASSPLAEGTSLTTLGTNYSRSAVDAKFAEGLKYYQANKYTDMTLGRIFAGRSIIDGGVGDFDASVFEPSSYWLQSSTDKTVTSNVTFSDVSDTSEWYYGWVSQAANAGLMTGYTGTTNFGPNDDVSRGMVVTLLYRAYTGNTAATTNNNVNAGFADVQSGQYYAAAVKWAAEAGITTGTSSSTFEPDRSVTREELATFIARYAAYAKTAGKSTDIASVDSANVNFDAITINGASSVSEFAKNGIAWCYAKDIVTGIGGTELAPQGNASRAQMAKIIVATLTALK
jgi:hypothetical protein